MNELKDTQLLIINYKKVSDQLALITLQVDDQAVDVIISGFITKEQKSKLTHQNSAANTQAVLNIERFIRTLNIKLLDTQLTKEDFFALPRTTSTLAGNLSDFNKVLYYINLLRLEIYSINFKQNEIAITITLELRALNDTTNNNIVSARFTISQFKTK